MSTASPTEADNNKTNDDNVDNKRLQAALMGVIFLMIILIAFIVVVFAIGFHRASSFMDTVDSDSLNELVINTLESIENAKASSLNIKEATDEIKTFVVKSTPQLLDSVNRSMNLLTDAEKLARHPVITLGLNS